MVNPFLIPMGRKNRLTADVSCSERAGNPQQSAGSLSFAGGPDVWVSTRGHGNRRQRITNAKTMPIIPFKRLLSWACCSNM